MASRSGERSPCRSSRTRARVGPVTRPRGRDRGRRRRAGRDRPPAGSHGCPDTGAGLVEAAGDHRAPYAVVAELERIGDVVRARSYPTGI